MSQVVLLVHLEELNGMLGALGKLPYEASAGMIHKLQAQANEQKQVRDIVAGLPPIESQPPVPPAGGVVAPRKVRRAEARSQKKASASQAVRPPLAKAPEQPAAT